MADRADITPEICRQLVRYDPETGKLWWLERGMEWFTDLRSCASWNSKYAGKEAFWVYTDDGYRKGLLLRVPFRASRLAWAITHGEWPKGEVDHINGIKDDNRICNLRDVVRQVNARNRTLRRDNRSGYNGVGVAETAGKWKATIRGYDKSILLGIYATKAEAVAARQAAQKVLGYSARHGLPV
ncbi:MAG: HNH endonuclease [Lysobacteraceae bacterium]|nr:MAG: HNH endonuclease [Xanthomonadaceae bacterium]